MPSAVHNISNDEEEEVDTFLSGRSPPPHSPRRIALIRRMYASGREAIATPPEKSPVWEASKAASLEKLAAVGAPGATSSALTMVNAGASGSRPSQRPSGVVTVNLWEGPLGGGENTRLLASTSDLVYADNFACFGGSPSRSFECLVSDDDADVAHRFGRGVCVPDVEAKLRSSSLEVLVESLNVLSTKVALLA